MALIILRIVFILVAAGLSVALFNSELFPSEPAWLPYVALLLITGVAAASILVDVSIPTKRIETITAVYFGLIIGFFLTYIVMIALTPIFENSFDANSELRPKVVRFTQLFLATFFCYLSVSVLIQTKDDFRFIIPYVEFAKEVKGLKPYVLDTSVVIDGRIADVVETGILDNQLVMPRFVLAELQSIADSSDKLRRSRGRRGLDILNRLRSNPDVDLKMYEREIPEMANQPVDMKLVLLAKHLEGKLVTGDYNLNKVARLQNVQVLNLNDLANSLKPQFLPGEQVRLKVVKSGEEEGQGVGYLDDGTMIVVEGGRPYINKMVHISVTSVLQTSAGRMIFGKFDSIAESKV